MPDFSPLNLYFMSQHEFQKFEPHLHDDKPWSAISITDPNSAPPSALLKYAKSLSLQFLDNSALTGLTPERLNMLINFLHEEKCSNRNIVVHCFMGVSRSAAIAKYMDALYNKNNPTMDAYTKHNIQLFELLMLSGKVPCNSMPLIIKNHPAQSQTDKITCHECLGQGCDKCQNTGFLNKLWYLE